jgi:bifunctional non-homologous end joining protein LigD
MPLSMISHPDKILFPDCGVSKGELCAYYEALAPVMLPHIRARPVTMERYPAGIDKKGFIQKDVAKGFPEWLQRVEIARRDPSRREPVRYPLVYEPRDLVWLANQNSITPHVWASRVPALDAPDCCVFDLDPSASEPEALRDAALWVRDTLSELGVVSFVKTSGSKGFHIVVALDGLTSFEQSWRFAQGIGALLVKRQPRFLTQEFLKAERQGRILVDTGRNLRGATFAAAYAVRARPGAPVSAPCTWDELERGAVGPTTFTLRDMTRRLAEVGDVWRDIASHAVSLRTPLAALRGLLSDEDWDEALAASSRRPSPRKRRATTSS